MTQLVSIPANTVLMVQQGGASQYAWVVYLPNGTILNTSASTTDGLQEAINYAVEYAYNLHITGLPVLPGSWPPPFSPSSHPGADNGVINYATPIAVPALQKGKWRFDAVTFNYTGPASEVTWTWDSAELFDFDSIGCQWVANTSNILMSWAPTNPWPLDPYGPATGSVYFKLGAIVQIGTGPCARLDATNAPIGGAFFDFSELNGGGYGLQMVGGTHGVQNNVIRAPLTHLNTSVGVSVGISSADANTVTGNSIIAKMTNPSTAVGLDVFGSNNVIDISVVGSGGNALVGLKLEVSAAQNTILCGILQATTPVQNLAGPSSGNIVMGAGQWVVP